MPRRSSHIIGTIAISMAFFCSAGFGGIVLENYELSTGPDPVATGSEDTDLGDQAFFARINPKVDYLEVAGLGGEVLQISPKASSDTNFLNVLAHSVSPLAARSGSDPFLNALERNPVIRFDVERVAGAATEADFSTVNLVVQTDASTGDIILLSADIRSNDSGWQTLYADTSTNEEFQLALDELVEPGSPVSFFSLRVRQHTAASVPNPGSSVFAYDNFALSPAIDFEQFRLKHFSARERFDLNHSGINADSDGDGSTQFVEYMCQLDPNVNESFDLASKLSNARLLRDQANTFVYRFLHPSDIFDFDWQLETSADLVNWLPVAGIDDSSYSDDGFWQEWSIPLSHAGDRQAFYRTRWSSTRALSADVELVGSFESYGSPSPPVAEVVSAPVRPLPIYGIYCWANEYLRYRDFIRDIGWRHTRLSGPIHDAVVRAYSEDGMSVMYTMATRRPFPQVDGDARNRSDFETDEAFISDYLSGVSEVLERYGPGGTFWEENTDLVHQPIEAIEVYNEPNFWYLNVSREQHEQNLANPDPERDARLLAERTRVYAQLLPAVYDLVKDQWPSISVVGFATGGAAAADVSFVENVLEANEPVIDAFDIFSTHPYVRPAPPEVDSIRTWGRYSMDSSLRKIRALLDERGRLGTRVWWTELGWSINDGFYPTGPGTRLFDRKVSRELQAAYYVRSYLHALRQGVERLSLMSLVDTDGVNFGLMDRDRTWRPSAHAVATMIALMPHPQLVHVLHDGENGVYVYEIKTNAHEPSSSNVFVAWAVRPQETPISVHWVGQQLAVFDQYAADYRLVDGNPALDTQTLEIILGPQPVYLKTMEP